LHSEGSRAVNSDASGRPHLGVVVPVHNEAENVGRLIEEIHAALDSETDFEVLFVDDASSDDTPARLAALAVRHPRLRVLRHRVNCGQSTAVATGVRHARAVLIATLDGDGQNDPADLPVLLEAWARESAAGASPLLLAGWRATRRDTWLRRVSSRVANGVRSRLLGDATPDTGCGLKLFERDAFLALPFFDHMHRFLPALFMRHGGRVVSVPVRHRPRAGGASHYGVWNRLWVGIIDLAGVAWLRRRMKRPQVDEVAGESVPARPMASAEGSVAGRGMDVRARS
jgi:dolichol-phosphate mannosyltransferase